MSKQNIDKEIKKAKQDYNNAREDQAVGGEYANDYLHLQGIKFYKPAFAHGWVLKRLRRAGQVTASINDFPVCAAYCLAFDYNLVRNKVMNEITNSQIVQRAYEWLFENKITEETIADVFEKLVDPVFSGDEEEESADGEGKEPKAAEPSHSGGPE